MKSGVIMHFPNIIFGVLLLAGFRKKNTLPFLSFIDKKNSNNKNSKIIPKPQTIYLSKT